MPTRPRRPLPPREPRDPGSPGAARLAWVLAILAIGIVATIQQMGAVAATAPEETGPLRPADATLDLFGRLLIKFDHALASLDPAAAEDGLLASMAMPTLEEFAQTPEDRLRLAIVLAELRGPEAAIEQLERATTPDRLAELPGEDARAALLEDADLLLALYSSPAPEGADRAAFDPDDPDAALPFTEAERERLRAHHGRLGDVALSYPLADDHPLRAKVLEGGGRILLAVTGVVAVGLVGALVGTALLILTLILSSTGRMTPRMTRPEPGGSVYLEVLPVFAIAFLAIALVVPLFTASLTTRDQLVIQIGAQWLILPIVFLWPRLRGVPFAALLRDMGWHRGRGVLREVGVGVLGYMAALPMLFLAALLVQLLALLQDLIFGPGGQSAPANPIAETLLNADIVLIALVFALATIWAPIVEETVFRGGPFRHLRARAHWLPAALLLSFAFAIMHGYGLIFTPPLMALALAYAFLRHWRGSIIAPVTAHCVQNAVAMTLTLLLLPALA